MPIATPKLAGADPCRVEPSVRMHSAAKSEISGTISIELGYGSAGGLATWQVSQGKLYAQRLDLAGKPSGSPRSFEVPRTGSLKLVRPLSNGFVILAQDFSENPPRHWFAWITDEAGNIVDLEDLDLGPHVVEAVSPVVADRMLLFLGNRRSTNQETSRVLLLTLSGGRARQHSLDFPTVTPTYQPATVELALGARDWSVWLKQPEQPAQLLSPRGIRAVPSLRFPSPRFGGYPRFNLRYLGDTLQALTTVDENNEPGAVTLLRIDTLEPDGTPRAGKPFEFVPAAELPLPFTNELAFSFDSNTAKRETRIGAHPVGVPIPLASVSPPVTDPTSQASAAWSSTHWVIAYWNETADGGSMNIFAIRCGP